MAYDCSHSLERLRKLLIGRTVLRIEKNPLSEGMITLFAADQKDVVEVPLFATGLGWRIQGVKRHKKDAPTTENTAENISTYATVEDMLEAFFAVCEESPVPLKVEPVEDVMRRRLGFHVVGGKIDAEFWVDITGIKGSPWAKHFSTPEGRAKIAKDPLYWGFYGPK